METISAYVAYYVSRITYGSIFHRQILTEKTCESDFRMPKLINYNAIQFLSHLFLTSKRVRLVAEKCEPDRSLVAPLACDRPLFAFD